MTSTHALRLGEAETGVPRVEATALWPAHESTSAVRDGQHALQPDPAPPAPPVANLTCALPGCDNTFLPRGKKRCCSEAHGKRLWMLRAMAENPDRYKTPRPCSVCGVEFLSAKPDAKYHSDECKSAAYAANPPSGGRPRVDPWCPSCRTPMARWEWCPPCERRRMAKVRLAAAAAGTSGVGPWYVGPCRECSTSFATKQPHAEWCSDICQRRFMRRHGSQSLSSNRKRARYYGCEYEPIRRPDVYERDAWVCGICSLPTTPHATVPDWNAPTIDHVVPMSLGGGHTYENVQCAHFICNTRKGIKLLTDVA